MRTRRAGAAVAAAATALGVVIAVAPVAQAAPALPDGFVLVDTPTGQQPGMLTDVAYLPDGSVLTTGRLGSVQWVPQGGQPVEIGTIPVYTGGSLGLTSIAVSPDYATTRTIYTTQAVSTSPTARVFRLSKWKTLGTNEPTGLTDEATILEFPTNADSKGIQDVAVEPALGTDLTKTVLWVAIGDNATVQQPATATKDNVDQYALRAMDVTQPTGKILRVWPNGRAVEDNPFFDTNDKTSWRSRNYLSGLRDPRLTLDPRGGVVVTDSGWAARDEVNLAFPGQNLKWPCWEGTNQSPGYKDLPACTNVPNTEPLHEINRGATGTRLGGVPYMGTSYPEAYRGAHFLADKEAHTISTFRYDSSGTVTQAATSFATDIGDPVSIATAPNGDMVIADGAASTLRRINYKPTNKSPIAGFNATVDPATLKVSLDAGTSLDPDREALTYAWDFGDGSTGTGKLADHTYAVGDRVTVTLTVTDPLGAATTTSAAVVPGEASPQLTLTTPNPDTVFSANQTIAVGASAQDPTDGPLAVLWKAERVRCVRDRSCEITQLQTGNGSDFTIAFPNETSGHVIITASAVNNRQVFTSRQYVANPRLVQFNVLSKQPTQFRVAANEHTQRLATVGSTIEIAVPQVSLNGAAKFVIWSDNSATDPIRHITVPIVGLTLSAEYVSATQKRYNEDTVIRATLGAPSGIELYESASQWQQYTNGRLYWTATHGVKAVFGDIGLRYVALGGHGFLGAPSTDELVGAKAGGLYNHFVGGASTDGPASIYFTRATGPKAMWGPIRAKYVALGAEANVTLGYPVEDLTGTPDGVGRYVHFERPGSIYWSPDTGAFSVIGGIREKWAALGWETFLGYPTTDETGTPAGGGRFNHFASTTRGPASIYYTPATGSNEVYGSIRERWALLGWETNLGFPSTGELSTPTKPGRFNHFRIDANNFTSIYWSPGNGTWEIRGAIRDRWAALGWENSYLGFPKSGEYDIPGGKRSDFQCGYITWEGGIVRDVQTICR